MGPCIVRIFQYISNKMQRYTVYFIWKLLYMFRVVPSPIIRSAYNCVYSIWYLSDRYCYLPLYLKYLSINSQDFTFNGTVVVSTSEIWKSSMIVFLKKMFSSGKFFCCFRDAFFEFPIPYSWLHVVLVRNCM